PHALWIPQKLNRVIREIVDIFAEGQLDLGTILLQVPAARAVGNQAGGEKGRGVAVEGGFAVEIIVQGQLGGRGSQDDQREFANRSPAISHWRAADEPQQSEQDAQ